MNFPDDSLHTRRDVLLGLLGSACTLASCKTTPYPAIATATARSSIVADPSPAQLLHELTRVGTRPYSEEGIAVFLVCENLAPTTEGLPEPAPYARDTHTELAETFRHYADLLQRARPDAAEEDVAKIIEVLADQDFGPR